MLSKSSIRFFLNVALAGFFLFQIQSVDAAISKTSKRVFRASALPVLTDFSAAAVSTTSIKWSWSAKSGVDGYYLYSSSTSAYLTLGPSVTYYIDTDLGVNKQYTRWMTAFLGAAQGSDSEHITKFTYAKPPLIISIADITASSATLSWSYSNSTAYIIEYSTDNVTFNFFRTCFTPPQTLSLLSNKQYWFRMGAVNEDNEQTPNLYSLTSTMTTPPFTPVFSAVAVSTNAITWRWNAEKFAGTGITGYCIYYSTTVTDGEIPDKDDYGVLLTSFSTISISSWTETYVAVDTTTIIENSRHTRWIKAVGITESAEKVYLQKYTYACAPASCAVNHPYADNIGDTWVNIEWSSFTTNASKYVIECSSTANFATSRSSTIVSGGPSTASELYSDTKYDIRIGALNGDGEQAPDDAYNPQAHSTVVKVLTRPVQPQNVTSSPYSYTSIKWAWSTGTYTNSNYVTGYAIGELQYVPAYKKDYVITLATISGKNTTSYSLDYLVTNSTHTRYIYAEQTCPGYICPGSLAIPSKSCTYATPPSDVVVTEYTSQTISLSWKDAEVPASSYRVERSTTTGEKGPWSFVMDVSTNNCTDTGLMRNTTYTYRIGAVNQLGVQTLGMKAVYGENARDYSFAKSAKTLNMPASFYGVAVSTYSIVWNWVTDEPNITLMSIYDPSNTVLTTFPNSNTTYWYENNVSTIANFAISRKLNFVTSEGASDKARATCYTLAIPPANLVVSSPTLNTVSMTWDGNGASAFRIDRSVDNNVWEVAKASQTQTSFTAEHLKISTTYYFAVFGLNADGALTLSSAAFTTGIQTYTLPSTINILLSSAAYTQTQSAAIDGFGDVTVQIPQGALPVDGYVFINTCASTGPIANTTTDIAAAKSKLVNQKFIDNSIVECFLYDLYGATQTANFLVPLRLIITFPDNDNDNNLDNVTPKVNVISLKMNTLDTSDMSFKEVPGSTLDIPNKRVYADISHFSIYALISTALPIKAQLNEVIAYPNPYKPGSGGDFDQSTYGDGIVFENLTLNAKIAIFNLSGELVADLKAADGRYVWDTTNTARNKVASGLYYYLITNPDNGSDKKTGKITIIR